MQFYRWSIKKKNHRTFWKLHRVSVTHQGTCLSFLSSQSNALSSRSSFLFIALNRVGLPAASPDSEERRVLFLSRFDRMRDLFCGHCLFWSTKHSWFSQWQPTCSQCVLCYVYFHLNLRNSSMPSGFVDFFIWNTIWQAHLRGSGH